MIIKLYDKVKLNSAYQKIDLKDKNDFYLIGITQNKKIKSITFEISIDSGIKDRPLKIENIKLEIDKEISAVRLLNRPSEFYIKPIQIITTEEEIKTEGTFDIAININALDLGKWYKSYELIKK